MKKLSDTYKELGIDFTFPIEIKNAEGNQTYFEDSSGYWWKREYNANGRTTYYEDSDGYWRKRKYNAKGKETYFGDSYDYWRKREYDAKGNQTYFEGSNGSWRKCEYDANGKQTYFEDSYDRREGTPRSQSCEGKVIEVDGKKYKLTELWNIQNTNTG